MITNRQEYVPTVAVEQSLGIQAMDKCVTLDPYPLTPYP